MELKDPQKGQEILSEIKELVSSISKELALIETKMSEYQSLYESDEDRIESLDLEDDYFLNITTAISSPAAVEMPQPEAEQSTAIVDKLAAKQRWRTDMPGSPVKDIRSAIALNDRVLFINTLFDKDPVRFQADLTAINGMDTLAQAIDYFQGHHPEWNFDSDTVYRFMMAVRR